MRSLQPSIRVSSCVALRNACARSICSTLDLSVHDTSVHSASARTHLAAGHRRGGAVGHCPMRMRCRPLCAARRNISRSCVALPGTARSCPRMTTCGSRCASCASSLPSIRIHVGFFSFSCPRLKFISTTLGSILPSPNSHVRAPVGIMG